MGAPVSPTGLAGAEAPEPPARLGPSDGIPRAAKWSLDYAEGGERIAVSYDLNARFFSDTVRVNLYGSDSFEVHVEFADLRWLAARLLDAASAIEAASAGETTQIGSTEGESAVGDSRDAQHQSENTNDRA